MPDGYGYTDPKTNQRVSALRDMFDGGGPGRSGDAFRGGGAISALGNALKIRPLGSTAPREDIGFRGRMGSREYFRDMFDGGGAGRSSAAGFADGPYSGLANNLMTLGLLRPIGAQRADRMAPMRPMVPDMPLSDFGSQSILRRPMTEQQVYPIQPPPTVTSSRIPKPYNSSGQTPASGYVPARPANYGDMRGAPMGMAGLSDAQLALANLQMGADMTAFNPVEPSGAYENPVAQRMSANAARIAEIDRRIAELGLGPRTTPPMNAEMYNSAARRFGNLSRTFRPETVMAQHRKLYGYGF